MNEPYQAGFSLLELMAVILILAVVATMTLPMMQDQIAIREAEIVARRFISHAQFARQHAMLRVESVEIAPRADNDWNSGWYVSNSNDINSANNQVWITQGDLQPVFFKGGSSHFIDPHSGRVGILFNAAGAAKTIHGGFVANRLILGHQRRPNIERHLILGSGGRWRICDPSRDTRRCH